MGRIFQQAVNAFLSGWAQEHWAQPALPPSQALPRMLDPASTAEGRFSFAPGVSFRIDGVFCAVTEDGSLHWRPDGGSPIPTPEVPETKELFSQSHLIPPLRPEKTAFGEDLRRADNLWVDMPEHPPEHNDAGQKQQTNRLHAAPPIVAPPASVPAPAPQPFPEPEPPAPQPAPQPFPEPEPPAPQPVPQPFPEPEPPASQPVPQTLPKPEPPITPAWMRHPPSESLSAAAPATGAWKKPDRLHANPEEECS